VDWTFDTAYQRRCRGTSGSRPVAPGLDGGQPVNYLEKFASQKNKSLFIYTKYDTTFLPEFSREVIQRIREHNVDHKVIELPLRDYTMGETPFKFIVGYHICSYLKRTL